MPPAVFQLELSLVKFSAEDTEACPALNRLLNHAPIPPAVFQLEFSLVRSPTMEATGLLPPPNHFGRPFLTQLEPVEGTLM